MEFLSSCWRFLCCKPKDIPSQELDISDEEYEKFQLHILAAKGDWKALIEKLKDPANDLFQLDPQGRTLFHCAALCHNEKKGATTVEWIYAALNFLEHNRARQSQTTRFIDTKDKLGNTALHYAANNELPKTALALMNAVADLDIKNNQGVTANQLIHAKCPSVMASLYKGAITFKGFLNAGENFKLLVSFGSVIGYWFEDPLYVKNGGAPFSQKKYIRYAVECGWLSHTLASPSKCKVILLHPLVELFLTLKWRKIRFFFYLSMVFHLLWKLVFTSFVIRVFRIECCCFGHPSDSGANDSSPALGSSERSDFLAFNWFQPDNHINAQEVGGCQLSWPSAVEMWLMLVCSAIVALKEGFEISQMNDLGYFRSVENAGQWLLVIISFTLSVPLILSYGVQSWMYELAAAGILVAWFLVLFQVGKHPRLTIHVEMFGKVVRTLMLFMVVFSSIILAFGLSISMIQPKNIAFTSLTNSYLKTLAMMIGELDYDELIAKDSSFPLFGKVTVLLFILVVTITLFNLLVGLAISDIQDLKSRTELKKQTNQLEQIFIFESFLFSPMVRTFLCGKWKEWLRPLLVCPPPLSDDELALRVEVNSKDIPEKLRDKLLGVIKDEWEKKQRKKQDDRNSLLLPTQPGSESSGGSESETSGSETSGSETGGSETSGSEGTRKSGGSKKSGGRRKSGGSRKSGGRRKSGESRKSGGAIESKTSGTETSGSGGSRKSGGCRNAGGTSDSETKRDQVVVDVDSDTSSTKS